LKEERGRERDFHSQLAEIDQRSFSHLFRGTRSLVMERLILDHSRMTSLMGSELSFLRMGVDTAGSSQPTKYLVVPTKYSFTYLLSPSLLLLPLSLFLCGLFSVMAVGFRSTVREYMKASL
jgi:hypothetical protein